MKRLEAIIPNNKMSLIISAIEDVSTAGITVVESRGRGKGARPSVRSSRGTKMQQAEYNSLITVMTIVDDSKVEQIVSAILDVASTGTSGDGKIFISDVSETIDIQTRQRGKDAL
ncbi:P-II family nitrogen regulator [Candidatus Nitrosotenuis chungbukensis]|uniref:P-II family nitrogen regulator n=1 Tax=Candidatus Nitrosotenuis chungbukensis TaxID=1353246 RepID=UPI0005B29E36|nr:P-II family nitrogen regulator [Candidatus Nitrosotenuis chungbukensis]